MQLIYGQCIGKSRGLEERVSFPHIVRYCLVWALVRSTTGHLVWLVVTIFPVITAAAMQHTCVTWIQSKSYRNMVLNWWEKVSSATRFTIICTASLSMMSIHICLNSYSLRNFPKCIFLSALRRGSRTHSQVYLMFPTLDSFHAHQPTNKDNYYQ